MGVDIPEAAVSAILDEQLLWSKQRERRNQSEYYQKRNLPKLRHAAEKDHMGTLCAVGCTTAEYDCKKQVKCNNAIFANWTATEKKCLGIGNLYKKYFQKLHMMPTEL